MKFDIERRYMLLAAWNHDILILEINADIGIWSIDYLYEPVVFKEIPSNATLGEIIMSMLQKSRKISREERLEKFSNESVEALYRARFQQQMKEFGYKTQRAFFKNMEKCTIFVRGGRIEIAPLEHYKLKAWRGSKEKIYLPLDASYEEIGVTLWKAFEICQE